MLRAVCPIDGTIHFADEIHARKSLRCATCGRAVEIESPTGAKIEKTKSQQPKLQGKNSDQGELHLGWKGLTIHLGVIWLTGVLMASWLVFLAVRMHPSGDRDRSPKRKYVQLEPGEFESEVAVAPDNQRSAAPDFSSRDQVIPREDAASAIATNFRTLKSGTRIRPDWRIGGKGVLTVDNSGGEDAEVKVVAESGRVVRDLFIQQGTKVSCQGLPQGAYILRFAVGQDWDAASRRFTRGRYFYEFGERLRFDETLIADGVEYSKHEVSLFPSLDGNVRRNIITQDIFDKL